MRFKTVEELWEAWEQYKKYCDEQKVPVYKYSTKNSEFITAEVGHRLTYDLDGFCSKMGITKDEFCEFYSNDPEFSRTVKLMSEECAVDVRVKSELGEIPSHIASMLMSKYGYNAKTEQDISVNIPVIADDVEE